MTSAPWPRRSIPPRPLPRNATRHSKPSPDGSGQAAIPCMPAWPGQWYPSRPACLPEATIPTCRATTWSWSAFSGCPRAMSGVSTGIGTRESGSWRTVRRSCRRWTRMRIIQSRSPGKTCGPMPMRRSPWRKRRRAGAERSCEKLAPPVHARLFCVNWRSATSTRPGFCSDR